MNPGPIPANNISSGAYPGVEGATPGETPRPIRGRSQIDPSVPAARLPMPRHAPCRGYVPLSATIAKGNTAGSTVLNRRSDRDEAPFVSPRFLCSGD